jgi:hypothetical protein
MAAVSKAQAKLFRVAKAVKNRELNPHDASQRAVDIARTVQMHKIDNYAKTVDTHLPERVPPKLKEYDQYVLSANGGVTMGTKGDASFFGPDAKMKGGNSRSVYKAPKSSIHHQKNSKTDLPPTNGEEEDIGTYHKSYINDKSVPKNSIHNEKYGLKEFDGNFPAGNGPIGTAGDSSFIGASGIRMGGNTRKPVYKTPKSSIHYKKGKGLDSPENSDFYDEDNWETDKPGPSTDVAGKRVYVGNKSTPKSSIHYNDIDDENRKNTQVMEQPGITMTSNGMIDGGPKKKKNEKKDYDTNIVPKTSIHYGERNKVVGEPKMKFEKIVNVGFVPNETKTLKTQGDGKNNLTKAVMDLTDEATPKEQSLPVPIEPMSDTTGFPFANDDGTTSYPIPGGGLAVKKKSEWMFGNTPELPAAKETEIDSACQTHGEPSTNMIDIPCSKKPLIKKLMMFIKKEQSQLHEGITLKGEYNGKIVKLNTIYEGVERRFKTYIKNEGTILEIHFGPKKK